MTARLIVARVASVPALVLLVLGVALWTIGCGGIGAPGASPTPAESVQQAAGSSIRIEDPWARPATMMEGKSVSAVYMVIRNEGGQADRLIRAESDVAETVELHETKMEGGMMKMEPVQGIDVPAGGQVELKPGGLHVMLIGLKRELAVGDRLTATLHFERAGVVTLEAEVRQP
jgi:copper(I)-binding protein